MPESVKEALKKIEDESSEHSSGGTTTDNDSVDDGVVDGTDDIVTMESVSMEPEDTTGIEESDMETMADASVEQMDSSQNRDDSEDVCGPSWEDGPYYHPYFEHINDSD